ncbi:MAG: hypothetical protein C5B58_02550 [Acidobacteria bacterium]|nr:MAG: hypothetical protein C5B58_02550 [Acidobacteriota bacterium]
MKCKEQEALLIFRRWYQRGVPLLLDLQIATSTEAIFIKRRIARLDSADLLFSGPALSVTVNFEQWILELAVGENSTVSYMLCQYLASNWNIR